MESEEDHVQSASSDDTGDTYYVHSALSDDNSEGWIWIMPLMNPDLRRKIEAKRRIVSIKRTDVGKGKDAKPIYCEALFADRFYLDKWKKIYEDQHREFEKDVNLIFISAWYRRFLGIEAEKFPVAKKLDVKLLGRPNLWALLYQYPRNHPQALVLGASMMVIVGFGLGVIGVGLGIVGIKGLLPQNISLDLTNFWSPFGFVVCLVGFAITLLGIIGLIRR